MHFCTASGLINTYTEYVQMVKSGIQRRLPGDTRAYDSTTHMEQLFTRLSLLFLEINLWKLYPPPPRFVGGTARGRGLFFL
jgi:hypothetical protein